MKENYNQAVIEKENNRAKIKMIRLSSLQYKCKNDILCEYLPWFDKSSHEIKTLQKEYGIFYELPGISLDKSFSNVKYLLKSQKTINKITNLIKCNKKNINKIIYEKHKFLFVCKTSTKDEFRYEVYFGDIHDAYIRLNLIDSGGGQIANVEI